MKLSRMRPNASRLLLGRKHCATHNGTPPPSGASAGAGVVIGGAVVSSQALSFFSADWSGVGSFVSRVPSVATLSLAGEGPASKMMFSYRYYDDRRAEIVGGKGRRNTSDLYGGRETGGSISGYKKQKVECSYHEDRCVWLLGSP